MVFDPKDYPDNWKEIRAAILERCYHRCECAGECGSHSGACRAVNRELHPDTGSLVVLTIAHLWRGACRLCHEAKIKCGFPDHLKAMCQRCHLAYDLPHHIARARRTRFEAKATGDLFVVFPEMR